MVQEIQRHQPESHSQPLSETDLLVDAHVQNVEVVVAEVDERAILARRGGRSVKLWLHLGRTGRSGLSDCCNARHVRDERSGRETARYLTQGFLQLLGCEAASEDNARLREIVDRIASAIEKERIAGRNGLASTDGPAAHQSIQQAAARQEFTPLAERQVVGPIGIKDMPPIEGRWSIVEPVIAEGVPGVSRGLISFVQDVAERMAPDIVGGERQSIAVSLLQINLKSMIV